jgi:hypothetical protein
MKQNTFRDIHLSKTGKVSDKWGSYLIHYDKLFLEYRDRKISLLEIGIQNGGSMDTYANYFNNAKLFVGCDINEKCKNLEYNDEKINIIVGDANSNGVFNHIVGLGNSFDIIIDDGSHISSDILNSFIRYFPLIEPGGVYVVEETHTLYSRNFGGGVLNEFSAYAFFKRLIDVINFQWWSDGLSIEDYFSTFFLKGVPDFISQGWVDSIEFKNSLITIKKSLHPGHDKLGERFICGGEELVRGLRS